MRRGVYNDLHGMVIANSCNAMSHLYNVLKMESDHFIYMLDIPRKQDENAIEYFSRELELLADYLGAKGKPLTLGRLKRSSETYRQKNELLQKLIAQNGQFNARTHFQAGLSGLAIEAASSAPEAFNRKLERILTEEQSRDKQSGEGENKTSALLLAGGLPPHGLTEMLAGHQEFSVYPENCSGLRYLQKPLPSLPKGENSSPEKIFAMIARSYLEKPPCPRVFNSQSREYYYRRLLDDLQVRAVIYHDLLFCDMCHYDYLLLKDLMEEKDIPHLKVKTELGEEDMGQLKTRVEAFLEILE